MTDQTQHELGKDAQQHAQSGADGQGGGQQDENVEEADYEVIDEDEQK